MRPTGDPGIGAPRTGDGPLGFLGIAEMSDDRGNVAPRPGPQHINGGVEEATSAPFAAVKGSQPVDPVILKLLTRAMLAPDMASADEALESIRESLGSVEPLIDSYIPAAARQFGEQREEGRGLESLRRDAHEALEREPLVANAGQEVGQVLYGRAALLLLVADIHLHE